MIFVMPFESAISDEIVDLMQYSEKGLGWDGIDCGDWCRHRSNECSMAHGSPSQQSNSLWVYRVIPENRHHHSGGVVTVVRAMPPEHPLRILTLILRFSLY